MSVLIRNMKMPENCLKCNLYGGMYPSGCNAASLGIPKRYNYDASIRPDWCPLVELPEKHGRLIDESIVLEMIRKSMGIKNLSFLYNAEKSVVNEIYHAPTVIEAEGEG